MLAGVLASSEVCDTLGHAAKADFNVGEAWVVLTSVTASQII